MNQKNAASIDSFAARTAHGIGIEIHGGRAVALIAAGSRTPCARAMTFTTVADGQRAIEIRVVRCGSGPRPAGVLGRFLLTGLCAGLRGEARIDIGLSLDRGGVLRAWGVERASGARQEACFAGAWALVPEARTGALAALAQRVDGELARSGSLRDQALRRERERIGAWMRDDLPPDSQRGREADCAIALATLAGEINSTRRSSAAEMPQPRQEREGAAAEMPKPRQEREGAAAEAHNGD
ncbi:MAG: Hsp70 family protein [Spirochaetia bacterium]